VYEPAVQLEFPFLQTLNPVPMTASLAERCSRPASCIQYHSVAVWVKCTDYQRQRASCGYSTHCGSACLLLLLQVKALSSLEVARQRQSNRAQLHLGQKPLAPGPLQRAGLLCPRPAGPLQVPGRLQQPSEPLGSAVQQTDPAQQARAKLEAIRKELGNKLT